MWTGVDAATQMGIDYSVDGGKDSTWIGIANFIRGSADSFPGTWNPGKDSTYEDCYVRLFTQDAQTGAKSVIAQTTTLAAIKPQRTDLA